MLRQPAFFVLVLAAATVRAGQPAELQPPVQVTAGGEPIDVQREGHAAPFYGDFDGDGVQDLLVGEFHEGRLRIYKNLRSNAEPRFEDYEWFRAGAELGRVPTG